MQTEPEIPAPYLELENKRKRNVLLYALAPLVLLALLTAGVRLVGDTARKKEAEAEAVTRQQWSAAREQGKNVRKKNQLMIPKSAITLADAKTQSALAAVVRGQLEAIKKQNYQKALTYATPALQSSMRPDAFADMLQHGYSPLLSIKSILIGHAQLNSRLISGGNAFQQAYVPVEIHTTSGGVVTYAYLLQGTSGSWQVLGVTIQQNPNMTNEDAPLPSSHTSPMQTDL